MFAETDCEAKTSQGLPMLRHKKNNSGCYKTENRHAVFPRSQTFCHWHPRPGWFVSCYHFAWVGRTTICSGIRVLKYIAARTLITPWSSTLVAVMSNKINSQWFIQCYCISNNQTVFLSAPRGWRQQRSLCQEPPGVHLGLVAPQLFGLATAKHSCELNGGKQPILIYVLHPVGK